MRDAGIYSIKRALPRMSWAPKNLYNLWLRSKGNRAEELKFTRTHKTLFQQRWTSKAMVRAYHGDYINEKIFKRWYLPETLPDVRPRRKVFGDDKDDLEAFALRKKKEKALEEEVEKKGMAPVGSLMFSEVERRIDVFLFRCCFAHSVYEARRLVIHGDVLLNGKKHQNANTRLAPGDMVSVNPDAIRFFKPPNGEFDAPLTRISKREPSASDKSTTSTEAASDSTTASEAIYVRHPTARPGYSEIPTPYAADGEVVRFAWEWYMKNRPRLRSKSQLARMPEDRALVTMEEKFDPRDLKRSQVSQRRLGQRLARRK
ncbi:hypothetical protein ONZ45_g3367 [Pleurotus djamor]|nr:hypothetical protein ONZ45_g3367 [Pleurotus djamor]